MSSNFRIHPAIGFARVGNSSEFYLEPVTEAALPVTNGSGEVSGGLPVKPGTESEPVGSGDLRDARGALKRQASRFRIYAYPQQQNETWPMGVQGHEVRIGSNVDGKTVTDIVWTVHLANKKANWYAIPEDNGIDAYKNGATPALRNLQDGKDIAAANRLETLVIDPGPRTVRGANAAPVAFDKKPQASYWNGNGVTDVPDYPISFPDDHFDKLDCPDGPIDTLGEVRTDSQGRLLVTGGYGRACGRIDPATGKTFPLDSDIDNDGWFDDCSDGPVYAVLIFDDGSSQRVQGHAWVTATDPAYAPQTLNAVSLWDDMHDVWVRHLALRPGVFANNQFQAAYRPSFADEIQPIFRAAQMQQWNINLNSTGQGSHDGVGAITADTDPSRTSLSGLAVIRNPNKNESQDAFKMPLSLGDAGESFMSLRKTQYFFLTQWDIRQFAANGRQGLNEGEYLDKCVLVNCLGGRFSPGIDLTFITRDPALYVQNWQTSGTGPFRIQPKALDYSTAHPDQPFLGVGYVPDIANNPLNDQSPVDTHPGSPGLEPGDASKFMALPWHTDYNSCATHQPAPVPESNNILYWSWPAQRPVAVYAAEDVTGDTLPQQRFSVRGPGTGAKPFDPAQVGRFQERIDMVTSWHKIGLIMQGTAIDARDGGPFSKDHFLEVHSQLANEGGDPVVPWPNTVDDKSHGAS